MHTQETPPRHTSANTWQSALLVQALALDIASSSHDAKAGFESMRETLNPALEASSSCSSCQTLLRLVSNLIGSSVTFATATEALALQLYAIMTAEDGTDARDPNHG